MNKVKEISASNLGIISTNFINNVTNEDIEKYMKDEYVVKTQSKISSKYKKIYKIDENETTQLNNIALWTALGTHNPEKSSLYTHIYNYTLWTFGNYVNYDEIKKYERKTKNIDNFEDMDLLFYTKNIDLIMDIESLKKHRYFHIFKDLYTKNKTAKELAKENGDTTVSALYIKVKAFKKRAREILHLYQ